MHLVSPPPPPPHPQEKKLALCSILGQLQYPGEMTNKGYVKLWGGGVGTKCILEAGWNRILE